MVAPREGRVWLLQGGMRGWSRGACVVAPRAGLLLTLVYSSTNMSKSVWTSGFWKPLVHKNMSNFWNNIFRKFSIPKSKLWKTGK